MAFGLYTKNNLSEKGLDATDALQKLYEPQIQQDVLLFSYASSLESKISSPTIGKSNQIYGLVNESISDLQGNTTLRTKFLTLGRPNPQSVLQQIYTYSDDNIVWFDQLPENFDKRSIAETYGAPIRVSLNGSITYTSVVSTGINYYVVNSNGDELTLPAEVEVRVRGRESGASNALVKVTIKDDGTIDQLKETKVVSPGSGYVRNEFLEIVPGCGPEDNPNEDACAIYNSVTTQNGTYVQDNTDTITITLQSHKLSANSSVSLSFTTGSANNGNYLVTVVDDNNFTVKTSDIKITSGDVKISRNGTSIRQTYFVNGKPSYGALLKNELYTYRVVFSGRGGFFLYDDKVGQFIYLGSSYNATRVLPESESANLVISRLDKLSSNDFVKLYNLDGQAASFSYSKVFQLNKSISETLDSFAFLAEELSNSFQLFVQNVRLPASVGEDGNTLGIQYNLLEGRSINSKFRMVFRDPDGVLDEQVYENSGTYTQIQNIITVSVAGGHNLNTGDTVYLTFTSGSSISGKFVITVVEENTTDFTVEATDSKSAQGNVIISKGVSFSILSTLVNPNQTTFAGLRVPGIWLWTGEKYQRVFSSDEKAFVGVDGKKYISPSIYNKNDLNSELSESGENKYSVSAIYYKSISKEIKGFDTQLSVLIQNISGQDKPENGGFVYHRQLSPEVIREGNDHIVRAWPLFSYKEENVIKEAKLLTI